MKTGIRIIILTVMLALAVTMVTFTIAGFTSKAQEEPRASDGTYLLGEMNGNVAIFDGAGSSPPLTVTGIEMDSLRQRDREMIAAGLPVASREELAQLLEDLGS